MDRRNGFTLLELLIVLAILGALVAIALPQFSQMFTRVRISFEQSDVERQLLRLPQIVRQRGRGGVLRDPLTQASPVLANSSGAPAEANLQDWDALHLDLPKGWTMHVPNPIYYRFTGACTGGQVDVSPPSAVLRYTLTPPLCRPQLAVSNGR